MRACGRRSVLLLTALVSVALACSPTRQEVDALVFLTPEPQLGTLSSTVVYVQALDIERIPIDDVAITWMIPEDSELRIASDAPASTNTRDLGGLRISGVTYRKISLSAPTSGRRRVPIIAAVEGDERVSAVASLGIEPDIRAARAIPKDSCRSATSSASPTLIAQISIGGQPVDDVEVAVTVLPTNGKFQLAVAGELPQPSVIATSKSVAVDGLIARGVVEVKAVLIEADREAESSVFFEVVGSSEPVTATVVHGEALGSGEDCPGP